MEWEMLSQMAKMCHLVTAKCEVTQTQPGKVKAFSQTLCRTFSSFPQESYSDRILHFRAAASPKGEQDRSNPVQGSILSMADAQSCEHLLLSQTCSGSIIGAFR